MNRHIAQLMLPLLLLSACHSAKQGATQTVDTTVRHVTEVRVDTVLVDLPRQQAQVRIPDSISVLAIDVAVSEARINPDGTLSHSLRAAEKPLPVPVATVSERTDSVVAVSKTTESCHAGRKRPTIAIILALAAILCLAVRLWRK